MSGVYLGCNKGSLSWTLKMIKHYRAFIRSECGFKSCRDLQDNWRIAVLVGRDAVQARLWRLVNTAINRKAGIPDSFPPSEHDIELWRDCQLVQHLVHRNNSSGLQWLTWHPRRFRTNYMQRRYGHLLDHYWEMRDS